MFKNILMAVTPEGFQASVAHAAARLAKANDGRIRVVGFCPPPQGVWDEVLYGRDYQEAERLETQLNEFFSSQEPSLDSAVQVSFGFPHVEILKAAWREKADLVIMSLINGGQPSKSDLAPSKELIPQVCVRSRCPVLVIKQMQSAEWPFQHIVAATDFSRESELALSYTGRLARRCQASVHMVHAFDPVGGDGQWQDRELTPRTRDRIQDRLWRLGRNYLDGTDYSLSSQPGTPSDEIIGHAADQNADLIVMAHHRKRKYTPAEDEPSVTVCVAQEASCPTMSVNRLS